MSMQEPLEELLAHLKDAIEAAEDGTGDKAELARLAGELDRRLNDTDEDGVVDDLRGRGAPLRGVAPEAGGRHRAGRRRVERHRPVAARSP